MTKPVFSVLIPVYNTSKTLRKCIDSVISERNSFSDAVEIIIIDDGSTDESASIISSYGEAVKVITNDVNSGLVTARIRGMKAATGQYIINLDSDDYLEKEALSKLFDYIRSLKDIPDIIEYSYIREPENKIITHLPDTKDRLYKLLIHEYPPTIWNKCYSAEIVKKALEIMEEFYCVFSEDCYLSICFNLAGASYGYFNEPLMHYIALEGVSMNKDVTNASLERSADSLNNSWEKVCKLIEKYRPEMMKYTDEFRMSSVRFLKRLATNDTLSYDRQYELLKLLDQKFETSFVAGLFENNKKYENYKALGRKAKLKALTSEQFKILGGK